MALTSRAPFNKNQFTSFSLGNVADASPPAIVGFAAIIERQDPTVVLGNVPPPPTVSALNPLGIGPQSRYSKFRSRAVATSITPFAFASGAPSESNDFVAGFGSVNAPVVSSLNPANLGPPLAAPFNLNQFKALRFAAESTPIVFANTFVALNEGSDIVVGLAGTTLSGTAAVVENSDSLTSLAGSILTGAGLIVESSDIAAALSIAGASTAANIVEPYDVVSALGGTAIVGVGLIVESTDLVAARTAAAVSAFASIVEANDALRTLITPSTLTFANIVERFDVAAGGAAAGLSSFANIIESSDALNAQIVLSLFGTAPIIETPDAPNAVGFEGAQILANASIYESSDLYFLRGQITPEFYFRDAVVIALSQTGFQGAVSSYLAGSACFVTASYYDTTGQPYLPTQVQYAVVDVFTGEQLVPFTPIVPATVNEITITSPQNLMVSLTREFEPHEVIFQVTDGLGDVFYARTIFFVKRTPGLQSN